ncbi:alpha/beta hydrolase [Flavobacterium psychroterrae]|uniref:Alpha/beta hydrolase n=1 Tax=Flavobacterium psychroterrae TaxID=2133767 RepID=A0ABS5PGG0_9FLAO|nr:alpha/beta hydrolase [Flavobacterium psychroterrae]MBS7233388.1 alpha/beta hydrolase [Flavobacterium psychroterrae]
MKKENITIEGQAAHYCSIATDGEEAHFYPGNGFPAGVYLPLLHSLSAKYSLTTLAFRATWENAKPQVKPVNWEVYADDLIAFLDEKYDKPIVGIGHSQGATASLIAAVKRPDLFKELYLIEPVSVTKFDEKYISLIPYFIKKKAEPFKSALKKKSTWGSPYEYFEFLQKSKGFKRMKEENLKLFSTESLRQKEDGSYEFIFPIDWEVANYALPVNIDNYLKALKVPCKIILGKPSFFLNEKVRSNLKEIVKGEIVINPNYGHLIPLEAPDFCAGQIICVNNSNSR